MHKYPNFLICGVMKAGTTTIYDQLCRHPQVVPARKKEVHFFAPEVVHGGANWLFENEYHELLNYDPCQPDKLYGEASPSYMIAAKRIHSFNPDCKIIITLRDPAERAVSQYWQYVEYGIETRSLGDAFAQIGQTGRYIWDGIYHDKVSDFLSVFPPANVLIMSFEEYVADQQKGMNTVFDFLGLDAIEVDANVRGAKTSRLGNEDSSSVLRRLRDRYDVEKGLLFSVLNHFGCQTYPNDVNYFQRY